MSEGYDEDYPSSTPGNICDKTVGTFLVLCTIVGVAGNSLALRYFLTKRRHDLAILLYILICSVDICTSIAHFPVTYSFFASRSPELLGNNAVCSGWAILFPNLQKTSMFLVMLLSISRTIAISFPYCRPNSKIFIATFFVYFFMLFAYDTVVMVADNGAEYAYASDIVYCYIANDDEHKTWHVLMQAVESVLTGVPPVVIFFSFLVCTVKLLHSPAPVGTQDHKRRASVTVAIFTGLFLSCNTPYFVNVGVETVAYAVYGTYPEPFYANNFMFWYSWPVSKVLFTVLNAALNPVLYFWRMSPFRKWICAPGISYNADSTVSQHTTTKTRRTTFGATLKSFRNHNLKTIDHTAINDNKVREASCVVMLTASPLLKGLMPMKLNCVEEIE